MKCQKETLVRQGLLGLLTKAVSAIVVARTQATKIVAIGVGARVIDPLDVAIDARATLRARTAMTAVAATVTKVAVEAGGIGGKSDAIAGVMEVETVMRTPMMVVDAIEIIDIGVAEDEVDLDRADLVEMQTVHIIAGTANQMTKVEMIKKSRKTLIGRVKNE